MGKDIKKDDPSIERFPNGCYPNKPCEYDRYGHLKKEFRHGKKPGHKKTDPAPPQSTPKQEDRPKHEPGSKPRYFVPDPDMPV